MARFILGGINILLWGVFLQGGIAQQDWQFHRDPAHYSQFNDYYEGIPLIFVAIAALDLIWAIVQRRFRRVHTVVQSLLLVLFLPFFYFWGGGV